MEENDKYYTPEIEEFYHGFEFEISNAFIRSTMASPPELEWRKTTFSVCDTNSDWQAYRFAATKGSEEAKKLAKDIFRVKYLDREDIESLGFKHTGGKMLESATQYYDIGEVSLNHTPNKQSITIHEIQYNWDTCLFYGTVKNKSELKKIMKMIGIEHYNTDGK